MKRAANLLIIVSLAFITPSFAYKVEVHAILTDRSAKRSVLAQQAIWRQMGFAGRPSELPITPYAPESTQNWTDLLHSPSGSVRGAVDYAKLMAFGADIEDTKVAYTFSDGTHRTVTGSRAFNHFFNPQMNQKLFVPVPNYTSPDWILEDSQVIANQYFSYLDARSNFFKVFTSDTGEDRLDAVAKTIQTLGHVVHHIQDMAQPQHTRLDSHCDHKYCKEYFDEFFTYDQNDTSLYEVYTRDIIRCEETGDWTYGAAGAYKYPASDPISLQCDPNNLEDWSSEWWARSVKLNGYPIVDARSLVDRAPSARDFWTNEKGTGIADFSSRNFVTTDTAFSYVECMGSNCDLNNVLGKLGPHSDDLPLPDGQTQGVYSVNRVPYTELFDQPVNLPSNLQSSYMEFIAMQFQDKLTGEIVTNPRLASYSMFNERFTKKIYGTNGFVSGYGYLTKVPMRIFTTNYFNMDAHAALLMPRAVGYSAGLINYFFRHMLTTELVRFDQDESGNSQEVTAVVRVYNNSDYDLSTERYLTLYENSSGDMQTSSSGNQITIAAHSSRIFEVKFPNADYSGKASIVFYDMEPYNYYDYQGNPFERPVAEAGVFFEYDLPEPTLPCGESINASGGSEGYEATMSMGTQDGPVVVQFEAYNIPDSLKIRNQSGSTLYSTGGQVSGFHQKTFDYDSETDGNLDIDVTGNSNTDTAWDLFISCPNTGVPDGMERFEFHYSYSDNSIPFDCQAAVEIDGIMYDSPFDDIWLAPGTHTVITHQSCECQFISCDASDYPAGNFGIKFNYFSHTEGQNGINFTVSESGSLNF